MGNFLVLAFPSGLEAEAKNLFQTGLEAARSLKLQAPQSVLEQESVLLASFGRERGKVGNVFTDPKSGGWLFSAGTWFHRQDFGSGEEARLFSRYHEVGVEQLAQEIEGFFTIVIGDDRSDEIYVITDVVGSCHSFYRKFDASVAISGSSLLLAALEAASLDLIGCQEYLFTGVVYEDRTLHEGVRKLPPATITGIRQGKVQHHRKYWHAKQLVPNGIGPEEAPQALMTTLSRATQRIARVYPRLVCDLTGGYDSRALVAALLTAGVKFDTTVSGAADSRDVKVSHDLSKAMGLRHLHRVSSQLASEASLLRSLRMTDGEYDPVDYSRILQTHDALSREFDVSLNGSFGELARGYWWELLVPQTGQRQRLDAPMLARKRFAALPYESALVRADLRLDLGGHMARVIENTNVELSGFPNTFQLDNAYLSLRMQRWQGRIASTTNQLWPCLSPFMFRSVLEVMLQTPPRVRKRSYLIRAMLARFQPQLAAAELEHGYPAAPVSWNNFFQFAPLAGYYAGRAVEKLRARVPLLSRKSGDASETGSPRPELSKLRLLHELVDSCPFWLDSLVDSKALSIFLNRSRTTAFPFEGQWARLIGLTWVAQQLGSWRVGSRTVTSQVASITD